jgi:hypothetical protein
MWLARTTTPAGSKSRSGSRGTAHAPPAALPAAGADVVVLVLAEIAPAWRLWGWSRIWLGRHGLAGVPGLRFGRVLGSGHGGGFGLRPSSSRQGMFLAFDGEASARAFVDGSPLMQAWASRASECLVALLSPLSCRGSWGGRPLAVAAGQGLDALPASDDPDGPLAALTRASIRPSRAWDFWRHAPASQQALAGAAGCRLAAGLGEAPLLRQATFSIWDSCQAMLAYAQGPAHGAAIRAAYREGHFSEAMFARFRVLSLHGRWQGRDHGSPG